MAERVGWAADLVSGMVSVLTGERWNTTDVDALAAGEDAGGRKLPSNAWMALRRLGWTTAAPEGIRVNDRIVRMAQEQAGRSLRSAKWRADLTAGVLAPELPTLGGQPAPLWIPHPTVIPHRAGPGQPVTTSRVQPQ